MSDGDDSAWLGEIKAKIAGSIADPRPPLTDEGLAEALERDLDDLYGKEEVAAA